MGEKGGAGGGRPNRGRRKVADFNGHRGGAARGRRAAQAWWPSEPREEACGGSAAPASEAGAEWQGDGRDRRRSWSILFVRNL